MLFMAADPGDLDVIVNTGAVDQVGIKRYSRSPSVCGPLLGLDQ
jgi:hypothetical protein